MEVKILDKKDEGLLSRTSIKADVTFKGVTPSKEELKKQIASLLKADEKLVVVKNVRTFFGKEEAEVAAYQYESEEDLKKIEPKKKAAKEKAPKEEKKEPPKEEKKEAPKEEKKEAPKEEEK
jgi:microtubule-associated protein 1